MARLLTRTSRTGRTDRQRPKVDAFAFSDPFRHTLVRSGGYFWQNLHGFWVEDARGHTPVVEMLLGVVDEHGSLCGINEQIYPPLSLYRKLQMPDVFFSR